MARIDIPFIIEQQNIVQRPAVKISAGGQNYFYAVFNLCDTWNDIDHKRAVFTRGNKSYVMDLSQSNDNCVECQIPWEVMTDIGYFDVGIFGGDRLPTGTARVFVIQGCIYKGSEPEPPTPDWFAIVDDTISTIATDFDNKVKLIEENTVKKSSEDYIVYGRNGDGEAAIPFAADSAKPLSIVRRNGIGRIKTAAPDNDDDAVNLKFLVGYSNTHYVKRAANQLVNGVYVRFAREDVMWDFGESVCPWSIPMWSNDGTLETMEPTKDLHCTNKKYVDDAINDAKNTVSNVVSEFDNRVKLIEENTVKKSSENHIIYGRGAGTDAAIPFAADSAKAESIVRRNKAGAIVTATPTAANQATNKGYVDEAIANAIQTAFGGIATAEGGSY